MRSTWVTPRTRRRRSPWPRGRRAVSCRDRPIVIRRIFGDDMDNKTGKIRSAPLETTRRRESTRKARGRWWAENAQAYLGACGAVQADGLAVEVVVVADLGDERSHLGRLAQAGGEEHASPPQLGLALLAHHVEQRRVGPRSDRAHPDPSSGQVTGDRQGMPTMPPSMPSTTPGRCWPSNAATEAMLTMAPCSLSSTVRSWPWAPATMQMTLNVPTRLTATFSKAPRSWGCPPGRWCAAPSRIPTAVRHRATGQLAAAPASTTACASVSVTSVLR